MLQKIVLVINVLWFGSAFVFFSLMPALAARLIRSDIPRGDERTRLAIATMPFLGGMNLALSILSLLTLYKMRTYPYELLVPITLIISAIAHGTQFFYNVPHVLKGGISKGGVWDVLKGHMLFIFIVDFICMTLNSIAYFIK